MTTNQKEIIAYYRRQAREWIQAARKFAAKGSQAIACEVMAKELRGVAERLRLKYKRAERKAKR